MKYLEGIHKVKSKTGQYNLKPKKPTTQQLKREAKGKHLNEKSRLQETPGNTMRTCYL